MHFACGASQAIGGSGHRPNRRQLSRGGWRLSFTVPRSRTMADVMTTQDFAGHTPVMQQYLRIVLSLYKIS